MAEEEGLSFDGGRVCLQHCFCSSTVRRFRDGTAVRVVERMRLQGEYIVRK